MTLPGGLFAMDQTGPQKAATALSVLVVSSALVKLRAMTALLSMPPPIGMHFSNVSNALGRASGLASIAAMALVLAAPFAGNLACGLLVCSRGIAPCREQIPS